jgi:site-specific DNA-cytosine methylase
MGMGGGYVPMVVDTLVFDESQITSPVNGNHPRWGDACHTLSREAGRIDIIIQEREDLEKTEPCSWDGTQTAPTLTARNAGGGQRMPDKENFNAVLEPKTYGLDRASYNQGKNAQYDFSVEEERIGAQVAKGPGAVATSVVRRLMPDECELLQGYEIGWTLIGRPEEVEVKDYDITYDDDGNETSKTQTGTHTEIAYFYTDRFGKKRRCADSSRYKAIGNSIAVGYANNQSGFWMWLMKRISAQYERSATLGSLFDGIGGFPLAWEFYNGRGSALWASEIEDFCIEVTRRRFPDPDDPAVD